MAKNEYTWEEVARHNTPEDAWIAIDGQVYDITKFIPLHPGGQEFLGIAAGRDCTDLFHSYHVFTDKPASILPKYRIGTLVTYELNRYKPDSGFYKKCAQKVKQYFEDNKLHPKDPIPGISRLIPFVLTLMITYYTIFVYQAPVLISVLAATVYGIVQAMCLLHQMHDASHSSIGYGPIWWKIISRFTMEWIAGASIMSWFHQHILGHHIYTNIMSSDPDMPFLPDGDLRFLVKRQKYKHIYKYQHIYMPLLYGLLALKFRIQDFTWTFMAESNGAIKVNPLSRAEWVHFLLTKIFFGIFRLVFPVMLFGFSVKATLLYFFVTEVASGYWLAFNFQVSHISTEAVFPCDTNFEKDISREWAVSQVITSVDYSHNDFIMTLLCGALNYQTVHHLFPGVSQYHYPAIAPIIQEVCKEYKVPYTVLPTFSDALKAHIQFLYKMGNPDSK